jgi:hypothetical protein
MPSLKDLKKRNFKNVSPNKISLETNAPTVQELNETFIKTLSLNSKIQQQKDDSDILNTTKKALDKQVANRKQTDSKQIANGKQTGSKQVAEKHQLVSKRVAEQVAEQVAIGEQTGSKRVAKQVANFSIFDTSGNERKILETIFLICRNNGTKTSPPLTLDLLLSSTKLSTKDVLKNAIHRLTHEKNLLIRDSSKTGRGGWIKFRFPDHIFQSLIIETDSKRVAIGEQTGSKQVAERVAEQVASVSSSSSSFNINNKPTTNEQTNIFELPQEWLDIDFSELDGFSIHHLKQLYQREVSSPDQLQNSINAFVFDLKENGKATRIKSKDPIPYFLAILNRQGVYVPPANYESPRDKSMREYFAKEKERMIKRNQMEEDVLSVSFENWHDGLSKKNKCELLNMESSEFVSESMMKPLLKTHYQEHIWLDVKRKILG